MAEIFYAGIGSRKTPQNVLDGFQEIGRRLGNMDCILRSGRADGADSYFEKGAREVHGKCEIYIPWSSFQKDSELSKFSSIVFDSLCSEQKQAALESVNQYHPAPERLSQGSKKLMARNYCQLFGKEPNSAITDFVVCYTKDGQAGGGTGQAIRMAKDHNIKVFNAYGYEDNMLEFINKVCSCAFVHT